VVSSERRPEGGLTVAVTGPTGDIGRSLLGALERSRKVKRVLGMARRPFDPSERGWRKVEYRRGDVLDRSSVDELVAGADVVVHLAFIIFGSHDETREVNLKGSRTVFEATVEAGVPRLVYTSSVAAYGFHPDNPEVLSEEVQPRGTEEFYYSAQKAELEGLLDDILAGTDTEPYVFRPCIVAGEDALTVVETLVRQFQLAGRVPLLKEVYRRVPLVKPAIPDSGMPLQLVHHDDVAAALVAAVEGRGEPGIYNLAADDGLTMRELAAELGWYTLPVPGLAVEVTAEIVSRLRSLLPTELAWVNAMRVPVVMDTSKAKRELGWRPEHSGRTTLRETVSSARARGVV
jgi:UDP-glucose 4-epimerase